MSSVWLIREMHVTVDRKTAETTECPQKDGLLLHGYFCLTLRHNHSLSLRYLTCGPLQPLLHRSLGGIYFALEWLSLFSLSLRRQNFWEEWPWFSALPPIHSWFHHNPGSTLFSNSHQWLLCCPIEGLLWSSYIWFCWPYGIMSYSLTPLTLDFWSVSPCWVVSSTSAPAFSGSLMSSVFFVGISLRVLLASWADFNGRMPSNGSDVSPSLILFLETAHLSLPLSYLKVNMLHTVL